MKTRTILLTLIVAACCLLAVQPIQAQNGDSQTSVYQTTFGSNPNWITNTGGASSNYYWDSGKAMYYFSIEPSSGSYSYIPVDFDDGSFTLDYDVIITRIDSGATFRMGLSGSEMDPSKGPNVISMFTNAKYGQIMWLHYVSTGNKLVEVNSQSAAVEMGTDAYKGATVKYDVNKTYHITVNYNDDTKVLSMNVKEWQSGNDIWSYFIQCGENLRGLNRIYLGSKGDYGMQNIYAKGYIDNVRFTVPSNEPVISETPAAAVPVATTPTAVTTTKKPTPKVTVPTPYPTETPQSPPSGILPIVALGIAGAVCYISAIRKN